MSPDPGLVRAGLIDDQHATERRRADLRDVLTAVVAAASDVATDDEHDPEGATIAYERARTAALLDQADAHLADIRAAIARLDAGTYDICELCADQISEERLKARPVARTCISCAARRS